MLQDSTAIDIATPEEEELILKLIEEKWVTIDCASKKLRRSIDTLRRYVGARRTDYEKRNNLPPVFEEGVHFKKSGNGNHFRYVFHIPKCEQRLQHVANQGNQATNTRLAKARACKGDAA